ncbi:hypothetical protein [Saccharopolyspora sp. NPDC050642]|uniref:hypothetical protein n=1 Tax=Saccharopolyspora sp. NPDC050642 TaxID=3157099 RepID=UPI0033EB2983
MSDPAESEIRELVEQVSAALRGNSESCQRLLVALAARAGWSQTRRLVLTRVHSEGPPLSGAA